MLRRQNLLETIGVLGEKGLRLLGNVRGMIAQDDSDGASRGIPCVEVGQQANELDAAVAVHNARCHVTVLEIQRRQYGTGAKPFVLVIAADVGMFAWDRRQVHRSIDDGLHAGFFIHGNGYDIGPVCPAARFAFCSSTS